VVEQKVVIDVRRGFLVVAGDVIISQPQARCRLSIFATCESSSILLLTYKHGYEDDEGQHLQIRK
jgi:hypothetical protein